MPVRQDQPARGVHDKARGLARLVPPGIEGAGGIDLDGYDARGDPFHRAAPGSRLGIVVVCGGGRYDGRQECKDENGQGLDMILPCKWLRIGYQRGGVAEYRLQAGSFQRCPGFVGISQIWLQKALYSFFVPLCLPIAGLKVWVCSGK